MKQKSKGRRSLTPAKSVYPTRSRKEEDAARNVAPNAPAVSVDDLDLLADLPRRIKQADEMCGLLRSILEGTEGWADRSEALYLLMVALDVGEDEDVDRDKMREAIAALGQLPPDERRRRLNGWSDEVFDMAPAMQEVRFVSDRCALPCLTISQDRWAENPTAYFSDADFSGARHPLARLSIVAGAGKRDVLDAIDKIKDAIADKWSEMIAQEESHGSTDGGAK